MAEEAAKPNSLRPSTCPSLGDFGREPKPSIGPVSLAESDNLRGEPHERRRLFHALNQSAEGARMLHIRAHGQRKIRRYQEPYGFRVSWLFSTASSFRRWMKVLG